MTKTVLVVEDDALNMKLFRDLLEAHGVATLASRCGLNAAELVRSHNPDLVLLDVQLPEISGDELARQFKKDPILRRIPIIAITALAMKGDEERIRASGCDDYLAKPVSATHFMMVVQKHLSTFEKFPLLAASS